MAAGMGKPAAGYSFNSMQEIKSHSSILFNERLAILFYLLDMNSIELNTNYTVQHLTKVKGIITQIYKNVRTLIRNNPTMRATLNLETKDDGIYVTDIAMSVINNMVMYCEANGYSTNKIFITTNKLNEFEMMIKDILQYYHYFIRPDFRQKPDIEIATEKYKEIADERTIDELRAIVGKSHHIDFESLGSSRVELKDEITYDENVDGKLDDNEDDEDRIYEDDEEDEQI